MKKLLCGVLILGMLTGCSSLGNDEEKKIMSCKFSKEISGIKSEMSVDFEYSGNIVHKQEQKSVMVIENDAAYKLLSTQIEKLRVEETLNGLNGVTHSLIKDEENRTIEEHIIMDLDVISIEDYKTATNVEASTDSDKIVFHLDKTIEAMEQQGLTCTK